jgi:hypothetical protein
VLLTAGTAVIPQGERAISPTHLRRHRVRHSCNRVDVAPDPMLVGHMWDVMRHRGPDGVGFHDFGQDPAMSAKWTCCACMLSKPR